MKKILKFLIPYRWWILCAVAGTALGAFSELFLPYLLAEIVNIATTGEVNAQIAIIGNGMRMLLVIISTVLAASVGNYCSSRGVTGFARDLRTSVFHKVQSFSQAEMDKFGPASLITRNTNDVTQIQMFFLMFLRIIVRSPVMLVGGVIMAYTRDARLARPLVFSVPVILVMIILVSRTVMPLFQVYQKKLDAVNLVLREQIHGIRVIRAFRNENHEELRFDKVNQEMRDTGLKMMRTTMAMMPALTIVMNATVVAIVWFGGMEAQNNADMQAGELLAVIQYVMQIMFSLVMMSMVFVMYPRAQASAERIEEVLDTVPAIIDKETTLSPTEGTEPSLKFQDVTFRFPGAERPALEHISFSASKGETVAFIGSTGSGKSSLLNLVMRFYDVSEGVILVNGIDVRDYAQQDLRARIGCVPQQSQLFSGTIADNLRFGYTQAGEVDMVGAAATAQALDFIQKREGGFDSEVSQGGGNLSGGQRQRLAIARAVARSPEIYLFDDSFSALDFSTDAKLRAVLREKTDNAIVLIVAQRVATIMNADRIIVLDNGNISGIGSHKELMDSCEIYKEIVSSQFAEGEVAV